MEVISEIVKFKVGQPERFLLAFDTPKPCKSLINNEDQYLVSSVDGRRAYVTPYCASKLAQTGAQRGDEIEITKTFRKDGQRQVPDWNVRIVSQDTEVSTVQAAPTTPAQQQQQPQEVRETARATNSVSRPLTQLRQTPFVRARIGLRLRIVSIRYRATGIRK